MSSSLPCKNSSPDESLRFLGLLTRGGKVLSGAALLDNLERVYLVYAASDASATSRKLILTKAASHGIKVLEGYSKEELAGAIGKSETSYLGVTDERAARALLAKRKE
jgi:ribosomal protein L7Ae-like RNA K-turn-binding protein